jgi:4-amino-4-deoxy-L-arabinose transferase-like glycosyltransferase
MIGVYCLGSLVFTPRVGLWAAAFYYTTPMTGSLSGVAYTDLSVILFLTAAVIALLRWGRSNRSAWIALSGALAGGAVGVKLNAMYGGIGMAVAAVVISLLMTSSFRDKASKLLSFGTLAALTAIPWYVPAWANTGNPTFPLLNGVFKSPRTDPVNSLMDSVAFGVGTAPNALLELPLRLTFNPRFGTPPGTLGVLAVFCAPFGLILLARRNLEIGVLVLIAGLYMTFWAATFQYSRYYMAILPIVGVLGVAGLLLARHTILTDSITRVVMLMLLLTQGALSSLRFEQFPERFPIKVALGLETREEFLQRALPGYSGAQVINQAILPGQRVVGVGTEHLRYYLVAPIDVLSESLLDHPLRTIVGTDEEIAQGLINAGYAFIFVTHAQRAHPEPWYPYIHAPFLKRFATLEFDGNGTAVYKLKREAIR